MLKVNCLLRKSTQLFFFILFFIFTHVIRSLSALVCISPNKCTYVGGKCLLKGFSGSSTDRNIINISCHSRLFFVLHLLVNRVMVMAIARKAVESIFILMQFFSYPRKQGRFFTCPCL